jgi:hypothetical protein
MGSARIAVPGRRPTLEALADKAARLNADAAKEHPGDPFSHTLTFDSMVAFHPRFKRRGTTVLLASRWQSNGRQRRWIDGYGRAHRTADMRMVYIRQDAEGVPLACEWLERERQCLLRHAYEGTISGGRSRLPTRP